MKTVKESGSVLNFSKPRRFCLFVLMLLIGFSAHGETFKTGKTVKLSISSKGTQSSESVGINESLIIELPSDMTFIDGIEISFRIPPEVAMKKGSVLWSFYDNLFPSPNTNTVDYSGQKGASGSFGNSYSLTIKIPLNKSTSIKKDAYSVFIDNVPEIIDGKLFLRLQQSPSFSSYDLSSARFKVTAKPIYIKKGTLVVETTFPDEIQHPYTLIIDGNIVPQNGDGILLSQGIHNVSLMSDFYRNEQRTVSIEQATKHILKINFKSFIPTVRFAAPEGTKVFMDGEYISNTTVPQEVSQGEHSVRFVFGNYEVIKTFSVLNGCTYTVSVTMDATITEEDD